MGRVLIIYPPPTIFSIPIEGLKSPCWPGLLLVTVDGRTSPIRWRRTLAAGGRRPLDPRSDNLFCCRSLSGGGKRYWPSTTRCAKTRFRDNRTRRAASAMLPVPQDRMSGRRSSSIVSRTLLGRRASVYVTNNQDPNKTRNRLDSVSHYTPQVTVPLPYVRARIIGRTCGSRPDVYQRAGIGRLRCTRSELVNCANDPLLQHENSMNIRGVSPEQDAIRHQTMEIAKINQSGSFDVR
ncbi:hypothetical protein EVAR_45995_1 [Eumeta japonica]|uniref:Uncharacterized protein n=1 Tax=Eumeta variegata TaxID=151549 RepID=A0A4C1XBE8_EUMVA|nr:hypothetical protein EVAR_45995_1 [Eumeta japonica]